jgi:hypothetical protein
MEKFVKRQRGNIKSFRPVHDVELKVAVKKFVVANLTPRITDGLSVEIAAQNVSELVHFVVNEGIDELLHSLKIIQAMNDKQNNTTH